MAGAVGESNQVNSDLQKIGGISSKIIYDYINWIVSRCVRLASEFVNLNI